MIKDGFSGNKIISRQRIWQMRKYRDGLCMTCGKKAVMSGRCLEHAVAQREYQRKKKGCKKRIKSKSYRLEEENGHLGS